MNYWLLLSLLGLALGSHVCIQDKLVAELQLSRSSVIHSSATVEKKSYSTREGSDNLVPIRFLIDYSKLESDPFRLCTLVGQTVILGADRPHQCRQNDILTSEKKNYLKSKLIPSAQVYFSNALKVNRTSLIRLSKPDVCAHGCEYATDYNETYYTTGVTEYDFIFMVTARPTEDMTVAYAITIQTNIKDKMRPIMGQINFGPNYMNLNSRAFKEQLGVTIHEMTHALGFSGSSYGSYTDKNGKPYPSTKINAVVINTRNSSYANRSGLATPNVLEAARIHFDCPELTAVELENYGGSGTAGSHWEKRLFANEYMTGIAPRYPVYSNITLALFKDTGWYEPNWSIAEPFAFGRKLGCSFVQGDCGNWENIINESSDGNSPKKNALLYTCRNPETKSENVSKMGCTFDRYDKAYCAEYNYPFDLDEEYRFFQKNNRGSRDSAADYCPLMLPMMAGSCKGYSIGQPKASEFLGEYIGEDSLCFETNYPSNSKKDYHPACLQSKCVLDDDAQALAIEITIGTMTRRCVNGYADFGGGRKVKCPNTEDVCPFVKVCPLDCSASGLCINGKCYCFPGSKGENCSLPSCPLGRAQEECSGSDRGECNNSKCSCKKGYTGEACERKFCDGGEGKECSNHGGCDTTNEDEPTCQCSGNYDGPSCNERKCAGIVNNITGICNKTLGIADCFSNFHGARCSEDGSPPVIELSPHDIALESTLGYGEKLYYKTTQTEAQIDMINGSLVLLISEDMDKIPTTAEDTVVYKGENDLGFYFYIPKNRVVAIVSVDEVSSQFSISAVNSNCESGPTESTKCSGNGSCKPEKMLLEEPCNCSYGKTGSICQSNKCIADCNNHGICNGAAECECYGGYSGSACSDYDADFFLREWPADDNSTIEGTIQSFQSYAYYYSKSIESSFVGLTATVSPSPLPSSLFSQEKSNGRMLVTRSGRRVASPSYHSTISLFHYVFSLPTIKLLVDEVPFHVGIHALDFDLPSSFSLTIVNLTDSNCSDFCSTHGNCQASKHVCNCESGYTGDSCQYQIKELAIGTEFILTISETMHFFHWKNSVSINRTLSLESSEYYLQAAVFIAEEASDLFTREVEFLVDSIASASRSLTQRFAITSNSNIFVAVHTDSSLINGSDVKDVSILFSTADSTRSSSTSADCSVNSDDTVCSSSMIPSPLDLMMMMMPAIPMHSSLTLPSNETFAAFRTPQLETIKEGSITVKNAIARIFLAPLGMKSALDVIATAQTPEGSSEVSLAILSPNRSHTVLVYYTIQNGENATISFSVTLEKSPYTEPIVFIELYKWAQTDVLGITALVIGLVICFYHFIVILIVIFRDDLKTQKIKYTPKANVAITLSEPGPGPKSSPDVESPNVQVPVTITIAPVRNVQQPAIDSPQALSTQLPQLVESYLPPSDSLLSTNDPSTTGQNSS